MKGAIKAASGAVCARCKHSSFSAKWDDFLEYSVPKCDKCDGPPSKLKVSKNVPSNDGEKRSKKEDIYRGIDGLVLTKISHAMALIGKINEELKSGTYKPETYDPKSRARLQFENYSKEYLKICEARNKLPQEHEDYLSPGTLKEKIRLINNELLPYFKNWSINEIDKSLIQSFSRSYVSKWRTRDLALGELRTMIRFAFNELGIIIYIPSFPKIAKARQRKSSEIPSKEMQIKIINEITNPQYKAMWIMAASLAKRPCEIRSLRICDIDLKNKRIITQRHFSKGLNGDEVLDGRKSISLDDELGSLTNRLDPRLIEIIKPFIFGKMQNDYLFPGKVNKFVSAQTLWEAWNHACKRLGVMYSPYAGTKSASLTELLRSGGTIEQARALAGHKSAKQTETYAKIAAIDTGSMIDSSVFEWGLEGVLSKRNTLKVIDINR